MARQVRDTGLETPNARRRLTVQPKPYWKALDKGLHVGYRKHSNGGTWIVRRLNEQKRYREDKLAIADDVQDTNGVTVLNFSQAQEAARKWNLIEIRKERGIEEESEKNYTVADAMRDYLADYAVEGKGLATTQASVNAHIIPTLGTVELSRLTTKKITNWHHNLAKTPARIHTSKKADKQRIRELTDDPDAIRPRRATANRVLTMLKAALNYAWREGKIANDTAWRKVKSFKYVDVPVIRYLTTEECLRLVNACSTDLRLLVKGALFLGCRYSALANLKVIDFNPDAGTVAIRTSKNGKPYHVVLTDEGKEFFKKAIIGKQGDELVFTHANGKRWGKSHQSKPLANACAAAEITPAISFHILRHTYGSLLAMQGVSMSVVAQQLGHKNTRMTEKHYAHLSPSYVSETVRQHFPKLNFIEQNDKVERLQLKAVKS